MPKNLPPEETEKEILTTKPKSYMPLIAGAAAVGSLLLLAMILACVCVKRKRSSTSEGEFFFICALYLVSTNSLVHYITDDANENKTHPEHIQSELNGFPGGNGRALGSPIQKSSRLNGVAPRMNITSNPLAQDGDKVFIDTVDCNN